MTTEQAVNVLESVVNATLKAGLFQNIADFQTAVDALNVVKSQSGIIQGGFGGQMPGYVTTNTADKFNDPLVKEYCENIKENGTH